MTSIVLYPRGFVGYDIGLQQKNKGLGTMGLISNLRLNKISSNKNVTFVSNTEVENIWKQFKSGNQFLSSFEFRKKIIQIALSAFGTRSFYDWCALQLENPFVSDMQKRFINDTFNFIRTGKRSVTIASWLALIEVRDTGATSSDGAQIQIEEFFGTRLPIHAQRERDMNSTICQWLSNKGGYEDLVGAMHVFFGDKDLH